MNNNYICFAEECTLALICVYHSLLQGTINCFNMYYKNSTRIWKSYGARSGFPTESSSSTLQIIITIIIFPFIVNTVYTVYSELEQMSRKTGEELQKVKSMSKTHNLHFFGKKLNTFEFFWFLCNVKNQNLLLLMFKRCKMYMSTTFFT